jgi:sulfhydrogenase subunit alpha
MSDVKVSVEEVTRVEGHGNIVLNVKEGKIEELRLEITESPRFFEAMLLGRNWHEATHLTCRICGICSIGHTTASLNALENGLGIKPSELTVLLRKFAYFGETIQSHVLHAYFLVAPDLVGAPSVLPLVKTHTEVVLRALKLKRLANDMCAVIAGRHIHPCNMRVKAFPKLPRKDDVRAVRDRIAEAVPDLQATVDLLKTLPLPQFERDTEYVALYEPSEYALYKGDIIRSTKNGDTPLRDYKQQVREFVVSHSHAKHVQSESGPYMVGALARFNINHAQLHPAAKQAAEELGLRPVCYNSFYNTVAQVVECVHSAYEAIAVADRALDMDWVEEDLTVEVKACRCIGAAEVPRGTLFHDYTLDDNGLITDANLVIPTGQNLNNLETDMHTYVPRILDWQADDIRQFLEMLVRAYDPCISCATHLLKVEFV